MRRACTLGIIVLSTACSSASGAGGSSGPTAPQASEDASATPVFGTDGGGIDLGASEAGAPASNCATGAGSFIYVISDENDLYTFDPTQFPSPSAFTLVGQVPCDTSGVNSMAVDRSAMAWVNFNDGTIYEVTTTAPVTCTATTFVAGQAGFTKALGMGFSLDSAGSNDETLFVSDNGGPGGDCNDSSPHAGCEGKGLATIDLSTMTLTALGAYTDAAAGYNAELTGTGDGSLYGFFTTSPATYGPIDKATGATASPSSLPTVDASSGGYAFSFWGGDFYFYTAPSNQTKVTHLQTSTGTTTTSPELSFTIVGAGVSTCAPIAPPK